MSMTIKEACERVYAGRRQLSRLHIDPSRENVEIVIGRSAWTDLINEYRELLASENRYTLYRLAGPFEEPTLGDIQIFGIRARCSQDLGPYEIRFRSEVTL